MGRAGQLGRPAPLYEIGQMLLNGVPNKEITERLRASNATITLVKRLTGFFDAYPKQHAKRWVLENRNLSAREIAELSGLSKKTVQWAASVMKVSLPTSQRCVPRSVKPYPVTLVLRDYRVPLECVTHPYKPTNTDEWLVDLKGLAGVHREVPVASVEGIR